MYWTCIYFLEFFSFENQTFVFRYGVLYNVGLFFEVDKQFILYMLQSIHP